MSSRREKRGKKPEPLTARRGSEATQQFWSAKRAYLAFLLLTLVAAFTVYAPALNGGFVFDDQYLPFGHPDMQKAPLKAWLGVRPVLMFSFWITLKIWGLTPAAFHAGNIVLHWLNGFLVFFILRNLLRKVDPQAPGLLAALTAAVFLFHPAHTESVAYIASRSEVLSAFFFLSAYALFLLNHQRVTWLSSFSILVLYGAAVATKEHTVTLLPLLLLTDYFFNPGFRFSGIQRNWKLYVPAAGMGVLGLAFVARVLATADTAGFAVKGVKWYEYAFTQLHVIWRYVFLFVAPVNLNADYHLPVTRSFFSAPTMVGLLGLVLVLTIVWRSHRTWPLAVFGVLTFLLLLAPTSSVVPIADMMAERRLYLPCLGLLILLLDLLRRMQARTQVYAGLGACLVVFAVLTYQRAQVWASDIALWEDTTRKSPHAVRPFFQLGYAYYNAGRCAEAAAAFQQAARLGPPTAELLSDWGLALECAGQKEEALQKFQQSLAVKPTAVVHAQIAALEARRGRYPEALAALEQAEHLDPSLSVIYVYRGNILLQLGYKRDAAEAYRRALSLRPDDEVAQKGLRMATQL